MTSQGRWFQRAGFAAALCGCSSNGHTNVPDPTTCYSPTQHVADAYQPGAKGCVCDSHKDQAICVHAGNLAVALFCAENRWAAGFDGPCWIVRGDAGSDHLSEFDAGTRADAGS
jgi:hypothetical protein